MWIAAHRLSGLLLHHGGMVLSESVRSKLEELRGSGASAAVVDRLGAMLGGESDLTCYKINAFRLASEIGVPRLEVVRALLFATRLGLFDLNWDIHCPSCRGVPEYHKHLMGLGASGHCELCAIDWKLDLEDQVEVTFTANPDARAIEFRDFSLLEFPEHMDWFYQMLGREGRLPVAAGVFDPGETRSLEAVLSEGDYFATVPSHSEAGMRVRARGPAVQMEQTVNVEVDAQGRVTPSELDLAPGPVRLNVHYGYPKKWGFGMHAIAPIKNWVSATYITSQQDFRDLFAGEFLSADASFAVKSVTLLFSDVKGSTEMYEHLGDSRAYGIVKHHFAFMTEIIRRNEGGIVKTIGDAVMATFPRNADGVRAACEIQAALAGTGDPLRDVEVKIGLHRGPAIVVTSNRNVDYFGRTVNIAARTQAQANAREVLLTDAVIGDPAVGSYLSERGLKTRVFEAKVKGVAEPLRLHALDPAAGRPTSSSS
jgi:class 3 adenylate cyclase